MLNRNDDPRKLWELFPSSVFPSSLTCQQRRYRITPNAVPLEKMDLSAYLFLHEDSVRFAVVPVRPVDDEVSEDLS